VNGERVGDAELTPGWTAYRSRLQVQSFTVTDLVVPGDNVVGALLSDGWWRGQNSGPRRANDYGATTALLAHLEVTFGDGSTRVVVSDGSWRSTPSHVLAADLIAGEVHDLRQRRSWNHLDTWSAVRVEEPTGETLVTRRTPSCRPVGRERRSSPGTAQRASSTCASRGNSAVWTPKMSPPWWCTRTSSGSAASSAPTNGSTPCTG
jgi:alpha-L-rhamnosidase